MVTLKIGKNEYGMKIIKDNKDIAKFNRYFIDSYKLLMMNDQRINDTGDVKYTAYLMYLIR